jgi:hypothetical protein
MTSIRYRLDRRRLHSMKSRNLATNDQNMTTSNRSDAIGWMPTS